MLEYVYIVCISKKSVVITINDEKYFIKNYRINNLLLLNMYII